MRVFEKKLLSSGTSCDPGNDQQVSLATSLVLFQTCPWVKGTVPGMLRTQESTEGIGTAFLAKQLTLGKK